MNCARYASALDLSISYQDLKFVGGFFGTLLLRAGVMRSLESTTSSSDVADESATFGEDRLFAWAKDCKDDVSRKEVIIRNGGSGGSEAELDQKGEKPGEERRF